MYKTEREFIQGAYPIFPKGMVRISNKTDYAVGLLGENRLLLAVWNLSDGPREVRINLEKYPMTTCRILYPQAVQEDSYSFHQKQLTYRFLKGKSARLFELIQ